MIVRLILGDQLNEKHSWFNRVEDKVCYVMMEMRQETDYVQHHIQKVIAFFRSMRNFHKILVEKGHRVEYIQLDAPENEQDLCKNLTAILNQYKAEKFEYQLPDEYRLDQQLQEFAAQWDREVEVVDTEHFMTTRSTWATFYAGKKQRIMEFFYRKMRKDFHLLMSGEQPLGGQWNFDKNNRNQWRGTPEIPPAYTMETTDLLQLQEMLTSAGILTLGTLDPKKFLFPCSRDESLKQLEYFKTHLLKHFGDYQDAMHTEEVNLFHSRISFALNTKMIAPLEVVNSVIDYYQAHTDEIALSQVEGFVRQIIGWREYMRGMYWSEMPNYAQMNVLNNHQALPQFFWTAATQMNCLHQSVKNSLDHAYAHHIQRLMITGNFALLAQVHPDAVDAWYLGIYADAIEWVQLPNTRGMSQWADGGMVATKPYVSAAAYIHKMSNYCNDCKYDRKKRIGADACPFNSLYWNFLDDKKQYFAKNNRMAMMLRLLEKIPAEELVQIKTRAHQIISNPDAY